MRGAEDKYSSAGGIDNFALGVCADNLLGVEVDGLCSEL